MKIASYNVENLFDLKKDGHEYTEYIPNTKANWNKRIYKIKLHNIAKVIKDIDADIIALEEVESLQSLQDLRFTLKNMGLYYPYFVIADKKNTTVKVALLSKIQPLYSKELQITYSYKYRNILETKFSIHGRELYIFTNHWKAKSGPESMRITSAKTLLKRIEQIGFDKNIILTGDFNSDYEENIRFLRERRLNDTNGKTGINNVLNTIAQKSKASKTKYVPKSFYNLWYDVDESKRYSYFFKKRKEALDSIIVSQPLLDKKEISYVEGSMEVFAKPYLFKGKNIYRWQTGRKKPFKHKGKGYSDHLPIVAKFRVK